MTQWIDLRENLQETIDFPLKIMGLSPRLHRYGRAYGDRRDKKKRPGDGQGRSKKRGHSMGFSLR